MAYARCTLKHDIYVEKEEEEEKMLAYTSNLL
jgi:hypothetical protein